MLKPISLSKTITAAYAAASARLCVETLMVGLNKVDTVAAASARLCVETSKQGNYNEDILGSRLRAAVC